MAAVSTRVTDADRAVKREPIGELLPDAPEDVEVLGAAIRVDIYDDASLADRVEPDERVPHR